MYGAALSVRENVGDAEREGVWQVPSAAYASETILQAGECLPLMGISAAARTAAAIACRFLFGCVCGADAGKTKKRGTVTVYGRFTAFHKYGGDFGGGIPIRGYDFPRIAARSRFARQRKIRRWMCRYIRNMPELPKETRRKLLHCEQAAFFAFLHQCMAVAENGSGTGRTHSEKRRVLLTFAYKARCGNFCGWRIGRMCKTRQAFSESS